MTPRNNSKIDIAIVTTSSEAFGVITAKLPEKALIRISLTERANGAEYHPLDLSNQTKDSYRLLVLQIGLGRAESFRAIRDLILKSQPKVIILVGLVVSISNPLIRPGDIILPQEIIRYELKKTTKSLSVPSWQSFQIDNKLVNLASQSNKKRPYKLFVGQIASGNKLFPSLSEIRQLQENWSNVIGVEMEAFNIAEAIKESGNFQPDLLVIQGVSDLLNGKKNQPAQNKATRYAVNFLFELLDQALIPIPNKFKNIRAVTKKTNFSQEVEKRISAEKENIINTPSFQIPSYDADQNGGEDYLNIEQDVEAFASLICARSTLPPLSIGLFGEWGSGKSFFMRKLRNSVESFSSEARNSDKLQKEIAYYKRVVQIEFNAWHYAEGNLWASLVEHILANLRIQGEEPDIVKAIQNKLLLELAGQQIDEKQAQQDVDNAQDELTKLEKELDEKKSEIKKVADNLYDLKTKDILKTVIESDDIQNRVDQVRENFQDLGVAELSNSGKEFLNAFDEMRQTIQRGSSVLVPFVNSPYRWKWIFIFAGLIVFAPIAGLILGWLIQRSGNLELSQYATWFTTITAWIGIITGTIRKSTKWVSDRITPIEKLKKRIDDQIAFQQNQINEKIADLEKEKLALAQDKETALQKLDDAKKKVELTEEKLKQATPARLRAKFIEDRVESNDYRKHLGVLALVRDDFEKLSNFIEYENKECEKFETLEQEQADADSRINRIVLYIDDLDRCSTEKVVQVLEAVHLLLAFPLFVVVVAVDARWVSGALYEQYKNMLKPKNIVNNQNELIGATALDYLEKIFQIPFWLSPMDLAARKAMIDGLVKINLVDTSKDNSLENLGSNKLGNLDTKNLAELDIATDQDKEDAVQTQNNHEQSQTEPLLPDPGTNLNPSALTISSAEQEFINKLSPLLGRSPRALKRFINVYRLVKSSVPEEAQSRFISKTNGEFRVAMFLLAIVTHTPEFSQEYLSLLYKFSQEMPKVNKLKIAEWKILFGARENTNLTMEQNQLVRWIQTIDAKPIRDVNLKRLIWWARRVSRFSFLSEPTVAEWLTINNS